MALPVRIRRGEGSAPMAALSRNDFNNVLSRFLGAGLFEDLPDEPMATIGHYGVDIREDDDHVYIEADLPGVRKEDVQVTINDGILTITAERREEVKVPAASDGQQSPGEQQTSATQGQQGRQGEQSRQDQQSQQGKPAASGQGQKADYLLRERLIQRFVRSFTLPPNVNEQHVEAKLENGVLRITLDKREDSKPKQIPVG